MSDQVGTLEEISKLKLKLEKAFTNRNFEVVSDILRLLQQYNISMKVHETVRIGVLVNEIKHNIANEDVVQLAKSLLVKWKKISKQPQTTSGLLSSPSKQASTSNPPASAPHKTPHETADQSKQKTSLARESSEDDDNYLEMLPESRRKMYDKLKAVFVDSNSSMNRLVANALALAIESAVNDMCSSAKDNKAYLLKCRDLAFNLSKNNKLREAVLSGELKAKTLTLMTSREMASDEKKAERAKAVQNDLDSTSSSFLRDNIAKLEKENGIEAVDGQFGACEKCGGTRTSHYCVQLERCDEPITVLVNCLQCGTQWRA